MAICFISACVGYALLFPVHPHFTAYSSNKTVHPALWDFTTGQREGPDLWADELLFHFQHALSVAVHTITSVYMRYTKYISVLDAIHSVMMRGLFLAKPDHMKDLLRVNRVHRQCLKFGPKSPGVFIDTEAFMWSKLYVWSRLHESARHPCQVFAYFIKYIELWAADLLQLESHP